MLHRAARRTAVSLRLSTALFILFTAAIAHGQGITGLSITKNAGNDADFVEDTVFVGRQRTTTVAIQSSSSTTFTTRYAEVVGADTGAFTSSSMSQNTDYRVNFNVTVPGAYSLAVATSRNGAMTIVNDGDNATADVGAVTGSQTGGSLSGSLALGDPGNRTTPGDTPFAQSANATITGTSNGVAKPHQLTFTWSASCSSSNSFVSGGDECAVRMGLTTTYSGETASDYPGVGGRVIGNDGHFVAVTLTSFCGNAVVEGGAGEQCDEGPLNGLGGSCCTSTCQFRAGGSICRLPTDACDQQEVCTGSSGSCPADGVKTAGTVCRASSAGEVCDIEETCDGVNAACPPDAIEPPSTVCRNAAGVCDLTENCTGASKFCPADAKSTAVCRASGGVCDVAESCDGVNNNCPTDQFQPPSTVCRGASGVCDVAENCTGSGAACPADDVDPNGTPCTSDGNPCTVDECDGVSKLCQHPAGNAGAICRAGTPGQVCDVTELCDGVNTVCPPDNVEPSGTPCTSDNNVCTVDECDGVSKNCQHPAGNAGATCRAASPGQECDVDEQCDGVNTACPADAVDLAGTSCTDDGNVCTVDECDGASKFCQHPAGNAGTECRADAGDCDVAEQCDGVSTSCPANGFEPSGTACTDDGQVCTEDECDGSGTCTHPAGNAGSVCRAGTPGEVCDVDETCDGVSTTCPPDAVEPNTTICRAAAGECDVQETCDGTNKFCPPNGFDPSGTPCTSDGQTCTVDECDGSGACTHPAGNAGTECRASVGECDVAEECDGANTNCPADGFELDGTACTDDGFFCTGDETCQGGSCESDGDPCTVGTCDENADQCLVAGCQAAPLAGCRQANKSILVLKDNADNGKDKLIYKWLKGILPSVQADYADPLVTADYTLCIYTGGSQDLVAEATVPPDNMCAGVPCWKAISDKGYKYKDSAGSQDGITKIILKGNANANKSKVLVKGRGTNLPDIPDATGHPTVDLDLPVKVQMVNEDNGVCFESDFLAGDIKKNVPGKFKGKAQ